MALNWSGIIVGANQLRPLTATSHPTPAAPQGPLFHGAVCEKA